MDYCTPYMCVTGKVLGHKHHKASEGASAINQSNSNADSEKREKYQRLVSNLRCFRADLLSRNTDLKHVHHRPQTTGCVHTSEWDVRVHDRTLRTAGREPPEQSRRLAILQAAKSGDTVELARMLALQAQDSKYCRRTLDDEVQTSNGSTALMQASHAGHARAAQILLAYGAKAGRRDRTCGTTALMLASAAGHTEVVAALLQATDGSNTDILKAVDHEGRTALLYASRSGHAEVAEKLLMHTSSVIDIADETGLTPLMGAARMGHLKVVKLLLAHGADTNVQDETDATALHVACMKGNAAIVSVLFAANARVDILDMDYCTPCMCAENMGHWEVVTLFGDSQQHQY